jgi:hypothetical protein
MDERDRLWEGNEENSKGRLRGSIKREGWIMKICKYASSGSSGSAQFRLCEYCQPCASSSLNALFSPSQEHQLTILSSQVFCLLGRLR